MRWVARFGVLTLALCALRAAGVDNIELLAWRQPIMGETVSGRLYRVTIAPEIFDGCRSFPADIRILDENKVVWPFFLWSPPRVDEVTPLLSTMGRRMVGPDGHVVVQEVNLRAGLKGGVQQHNQVSILTGGHDFIRRVEILGSADGQSWKELGSGFLVDQMQEAHVSNRLVTYEDSTTTRLLLRIHPNARNEKEPIEVLDVQVANRARSSDPMHEVKLRPLALPANEFRDGVLTLAFDTGAQNRPLEQVHIRAAGSEFTLPVKVFGRNAEGMPWRWIADGGIYRVGGQSRDAIDLHGTAFRQIKIDLFHYEQRPPAINSVICEALPQFVVFEAQGGGSPMLHFGAERIPFPRYDLQRRTPSSAITNATILELGKARSNPLKVMSGLSSYLRAMALFAGAVVACAVLYIVLRTIRARVW